MPQAKSWVIGGLQGIGEAIAKEIGKHGIEVLATDEQTADVISTRDIAESLHEFKPHTIVYCAGVNKLMPAAEFNDFDALNMLDVNALGFMRLIHLIAATDIKDRPESVVAISSDAATRPMRNSMAYCASKAALNAAVRCAARDLAPLVQVNAIAPGIVADTPMSDYTDQAVKEIKGWTDEEAKAYEIASIPMGRRAQKREVARMVYNVLYSPSYLTGAIIEVNGGR